MARALCEFCAGPLTLEVQDNEPSRLLCMHCGREPSAYCLAELRRRLPPGTLVCRHGQEFCPRCDVGVLAESVKLLEALEPPHVGRPSRADLARREELEHLALERLRQAGTR